MAGRQWRPFEDKYIPEPMSGCFLWLGAVFKNGYGQAYADGKNSYAHRVSWEFYRGPIPDGLHVLHRCDTPSCVNPDHLFLGTHQENMADRDRKGRCYKGEKCHQAKLTSEKVFLIREDGRALRKIAADYGINVTSVYHIKRRKNWKHLDSTAPSR